jgi:TonB family protein
MAVKAQIEGVVKVKVLVDKAGNVRDAMVVKASGANAGFEEAALEAAKKGKWKPAIQNKQPVAVWVSYDIKFNLGVVDSSGRLMATSALLPSCQPHTRTLILTLTRNP